ncbi:ABC transporter ATP-binding protein [Georgenia sp. TF02-10]|uniref:ABC transporter ATP-binding protein n=1 Tax=Georgenia sp. TF02-10 TaxID=2917725 RepID=UPI001FA769DE|nr:ABC transporter ATP-binding protein [Georgenia sp. TF02-10]UNX53856.1 ABC transporter ATP-binding protein [Georgenia sp. TF02-10]
MATSTTAPPADVLVRATRLEVGYDLPVCPPVTFTLAAGELLAVVGANGTGKSTLLRTVVGQLEPLAGTVTVPGGDPRSRDFRASVAADLGDDAFFPALTAVEHLLLTCYGHGVPAPREVVDQLVEEFGLTTRADALPAALSSGQRRRLLLAAAFARPRSLLVLDEPEQRLDPGMRADLVERLRAEREAGGAALVATHDPAVVRGAATAVLVLGEDRAALAAPADGAAALELL